MCFFFKGLRGNPLCVCRGGGGAKTPTLDPVCIRETPEKMIVWSLPPQMKNPRYGPGNSAMFFSGQKGRKKCAPVVNKVESQFLPCNFNIFFNYVDCFMQIAEFLFHFPPGEKTNSICYP